MLVGWRTANIEDWMLIFLSFLTYFQYSIYSVLTAFVGVLLNSVVVVFLGEAVVFEEFVLEASILFLNLRHRLNSFQVLNDTVIFSEGCVFR